MSNTSNYTGKSRKRQTNLTDEQLNDLIELAVTVRKLQKLLYSISVPKIASIIGISHQGLEYYMKKGEEGSK